MIEILILILGLFIVGSYKKDFTTLVFSGLGFIFYGLMFLNSITLAYPYNFQFGILSILFGVYVGLRSSIDMITNKKKEVKYG